MPALRRSSRLREMSVDPPSPSPLQDPETVSFVPTVTPDTFHDDPTSMNHPSHEFSFHVDEPTTRRVSAKQKKSPNYIPRPPNAFILFRSAFIRSQQVSSGVETNHSTLSKIIGMTWQQLSEEERQEWHAKAKAAQEEHKRKYPHYSFKPVHNRSKGLGERKKLREVAPKDQERCAKIAELLGSGLAGQDLEEAIQEYDRNHVPEVVTRFEEPITASSFSQSQPVSRASSPAPFRFPSRRSTTPGSSRGYRRSPSAFPPMLSLPDRPAKYLYGAPRTPSIPPSFDQERFFSNERPSFGMNPFAFSVQEPSPPLAHGALDPCCDSPPMSIIRGEQDASLLCGTPRYPSMGHWARSCSPQSTNSTSSMPTTPAHMNVPFPIEHGFDHSQYDSYGQEAVSDYPQGQPHHPYVADFSQYHSYSGAAIPEPEYSPKGSPEETLTLVPNNVLDESQVRTPMPRDDIEFSMFMASLHPPYSM